jgi:hypothetical protein
MEMEPISLISSYETMFFKYIKNKWEGTGKRKILQARIEKG